MLPAHLAENIHKQILYYVQSTSALRDQARRKAFEAFLKEPDHGLFRGSSVEVRRPFRPGSDATPLPYEATVPFNPSWHQDRAQAAGSLAQTAMQEMMTWLGQASHRLSKAGRRAAGIGFPA